LISKAISMSGGGLGEFRPGMTFNTAQMANKAMMDYFEKTTLEEMRALSFDELTKMANDYAAVTNNRVFYSPLVDNYFLTGTFTETARANEIPDIPYMFGYTANDLSDMTKPIQDFCALRAEQGRQPAYAYLFARRLPGDENGAFHSSDLWYVFHSFRHSWRPFTAGDEALSQKMVDCWTNFAKYGNPNGKSSGIIWTPYTTEAPEFMIFNADENRALCSMSTTPEFKGRSPMQ
jgi:para-nitrobenzyl esterase